MTNEAAGEGRKTWVRTEAGYERRQTLALPVVVRVFKSYRCKIQITARELYCGLLRGMCVSRPNELSLLSSPWVSEAFALRGDWLPGFVAYGRLATEMGRDPSFHEIAELLRHFQSHQHPIG